MQYPSPPQLRVSSVNLLTDLGCCAGPFHIRGRQGLVDFLAPGSRATGIAEWLNQQV